MTVGKLNSLWLSDVRFGSLACPQAMGMGVMAPRYASVEGAGDDAGKRNTGLTARYSSCWLVKQCVQVCAHDGISHPCDFAWLKLGCGMKADKRIRCDKLMGSAQPSEGASGSATVCAKGGRCRTI